MAIKWIGMSDEIKKRIGEMISVAPWSALELTSTEKFFTFFLSKWIKEREKENSIIVV